MKRRKGEDLGYLLRRPKKGEIRVEDIGKALTEKS